MNIGDKVFVTRIRSAAESHLTRGLSQPEVGFITYVQGDKYNIAGFAADGSIFSLLAVPSYSGSGPQPHGSFFSTSVPPAPKPVVTTNQASPRATVGSTSTSTSPSSSPSKPVVTR